MARRLPSTELELSSQFRCSLSHDRLAHSLFRQSHGRLVSQAPAAHSDSNSRLTEDDQDELSLRKSLAAKSLSRFSLRQRSNSIVMQRAELEELLVPGSSRSEMQKRYQSAFASRIARTEEEMDFEAGIEGNESVVERKMIGASTEVVGSGRRASISRSMISTSPTIQKRTLFTSSRSPPAADIPRTRRNSTSTIADSPPVVESAPPPQQVQSKPRSTQKSTRPDAAFGTGSGQYPSPAARSRYDAIKFARQSNSYEKVANAVRMYLAVESEWNVLTHHLAIEALSSTRLPNTSITKIVDLYNDMFAHANLTPNNRTYEIVITAFCQRDREVINQLRYLETKGLKVDLTTAARGPWNIESASPPEHAQPIVDRIKQLDAEDFFTPALKIYIALGIAADALKPNTINSLLGAAIGRKRIDLALSIFDRLENSRDNHPTAKTYELLLRMFADQKDAVGAKEVFDAYLEARANGTLRETPPDLDSPVFERASVKARYDSAPTFSLVVDEGERTPGFSQRGDETIWTQMIRAYFAAGDSVGAVETMEKLIAGLQQEGGAPGGYPKEVSGLSMSGMIAGFASIGDTKSALKWFDQAIAMSNKDGKHTPYRSPFYRTPMYAAVNQRDAKLATTIFLYWAAHAPKSDRIQVPEFMTTLDMNIASLYTATDEATREEYLNNIRKVRKLFQDLARRQMVADVDASFHISSGSNSRLIQAFAYAGRFEEAAQVFSENIRDVRATGVLDADLQHSFRTPREWATKLTIDPVAALLGLRPVPSVEGPLRFAHSPSAPRPFIALATSVVHEAGRLRSECGASPLAGNAVPSLVETYLLERDSVGGDVAKLGLDGDRWFVLITAFARFATAYQQPSLAIRFPGYASIMEDFAAAGSPAPHQPDLVELIRLLRRGEYSDGRIRKDLSTLDSEFAQLAAGPESLDEVTRRLAVLRAPAPPAPVAPIDLSPSPSKDFDTIKSTDPASALANTNRSVESLPLPPNDPPAYFSMLPPITVPELISVDPQISSQIDHLIQASPDKAYDAVIASVERGIYPHADTIGRLLEAYGRLGKTTQVQQLYLFAYRALGSLKDNRQAHSIAWIVLEDHMVIALCQVGALEQVAVHRDRLLQAGSAPSADGYAAMILNMKETTDNAAVALELFEESQRLNVAPNVYLFNTLISKLSRARRAPDALEYFEFMKSVGIRPSSITYGAIINACCKTGDDSSADFLFSEMVKSPTFKPRVPPYNTMIQFYTQTKPNRDRALFYYAALRQAKVEPTAHTYKLLLDAHGSIGTPDIGAMQDVFKQLERDPKVQVGAAHWASLINAWGCVSKDLPAAINVFEQITNHPSTKASSTFLPDAIVYESLLNACLANHRPDLCDKYLADMTAKGVRMTAYVANTLIKVRFSSLDFCFAPTDDVHCRDTLRRGIWKPRGRRSKRWSIRQQA